MQENLAKLQTKIEKDPKRDKMDKFFQETPEVQAEIDVWQNKWHEFDVYTHTLEFIKAIEQFSQDSNIRAAAWLHDIGKPVVAIPLIEEGKQQCNAQGKPYHKFDRHEIVGEEMVKKMDSQIFEEFDLDQEKIASLVGCHFLPMKTIKILKKINNFDEFLQKFNQLNEILGSLSITKEEVMTMFIADCLAKGRGSSQPDLMPIREALLKENYTEDDVKEIYEIQKECYGVKQ